MSPVYFVIEDCIGFSKITASKLNIPNGGLKRTSDLSLNMCHGVETPVLKTSRKSINSMDQHTRPWYLTPLPKCS